MTEDLRNEIKLRKAETDEEYEIRICGLKDEFDLSWDDIAAIINTELGQNYTESRYRKMWKAYCLGVKNTAIQKRPRNKQEGEYLRADTIEIDNNEESKDVEISEDLELIFEISDKILAICSSCIIFFFIMTPLYYKNSK